MALPDLSRILLGGLAPEPYDPVEADDLGCYPIDRDGLCPHRIPWDDCHRCGDAHMDYGHHE